MNYNSHNNNGSVFSVSNETIKLVDKFNKLVALSSIGKNKIHKRFEVPYHPEGGKLSSIVQTTLVHRDLIACNGNVCLDAKFIRKSKRDNLRILGYLAAKSEKLPNFATIRFRLALWLYANLQNVKLLIFILRNLLVLVIAAKRVQPVDHKNPKIIIQIESGADHHVKSLHEMVSLLEKSGVKSLILHTPSENFKDAINDRRKLQSHYANLISSIDSFDALKYFVNCLKCMKIKIKLEKLLKDQALSFHEYYVLKFMSAHYFLRYLPAFLTLDEQLVQMEQIPTAQYARVWGTGRSHISGNILRYYLGSTVKEIYLPVGPVLPTSYLRGLENYEHFFCSIRKEQQLLIEQCGLRRAKSSVKKMRRIFELDKGSINEFKAKEKYTIGLDYGFYAPGYNNPVHQYLLANELVDFVEKNSNFDLVIRPHPYGNMREFEEFMKNNKSKQRVSFSLSDETLAEFMCGLDFYCGKYSSSILDAISREIICFSIILDDPVRFGIFSDYVMTFDHLSEFFIKIREITSSGPEFAKVRNLILHQQNKIFHDHGRYQVEHLVHVIKAS